MAAYPTSCRLAGEAQYHMLETMVLGLFVAMLMTGMLLGLPLTVALVLGWVLFFDYGLLRGFDMGELARMSLRGVRSCASVLALFVVIGALTASWRAAGTIPAITCLSSTLVEPSTLVLTAFLLCSAMSTLTGSSFASAATTGVICMSIANAMDANAILVGGAILSGCFFGDRCSPLSSSAALVASLTKSDLFANIDRMARTGVVPLALCLVLYGVSGALVGVPHAASAAQPDLASAFSRSFVLSPVVMLPVVVVLVLSIAKVDVKVAMLASMGVALALCISVQGMSPSEVPHLLVWGYQSPDPTIGRLANGGGIVSMADIALVVGVASTYSGIFEGTGLLEGLRDYANQVAQRSTPFVCVLACSIACSVIACDQVVAIMLTSQLCEGVEREGSALALDLENSVVVIPALVPWSTSCVGIVAFVGMPIASVWCAFLCMLVPAWTLAISLWQSRHPAFVETAAAQALGLTEADDVRRLAQVQKEAA